MAVTNPKTRANYEPNSWGAEAGPRETPETGFHFPGGGDGPKVRVRSETFADHYSQARQFYISQTPIEQEHIAASFTFELSKVETPAIRSRMVADLLNVDKELAMKVSEELRLPELPKAAETAAPSAHDSEGVSGPEHRSQRTRASRAARSAHSSPTASMPSC